MQGTSVAACLALAGCQLVFPLVDPEPASTLVRRTITNAPDGMPIVVDTGIQTTGDIVFADGSTAVVTVDAGGAFALVRPDAEPYRLTFSIDNQIFEVQSDASVLALGRNQLGRRAPTTVPAAAVLQFPDFMAGSGTPAFASTGVWARGNFNTVTNTTDWVTATPLASATLGLLDATQGDRLYFTGTSIVTDPSFTVYVAITDAVEIPVVMTGAFQPIDGVTPLPLVRDRCSTIVSREATESARLRAAFPDFDEKFGRVAVEAVPRPDVDYLGAHSVAVALDLAPLPDATLVAQFANPFPGTATYAIADVVLGRDVLHPQATTPVTIQLGSTRFAEVTRNACESAELSVPPLVVGFTLAGTRLATDFETITLGDAPEVELALEVDGSSDAYEISLFELVVDGTTSMLVKIRSIVSAAPVIRIPAGVLLPDRIYGFGVSAFTGVPNATQGDFVTRDRAGAVVFVSSTAFQVL